MTGISPIKTSSTPGYTSSVDESEDIEKLAETKVDPKDTLTDRLLKASQADDAKISRQPGALTTRFGEIQIADAASEKIEAETEEAIKTEGVKPEAPKEVLTETIETARAKNEHLIGDNDIDGNPKELLQTLGEFGGIDIGDLNKLEAGKTLEAQPGRISEEQVKNLKEMLDNLRDPAKSGPYLAKLKANHDQKLAEQLKQRDERIQRLEEAKKANDPALIEQIQNENKKFAQRLMNDMERLKFWEESQKFKNAQLAATLAAIHDSIKLAASVQ